MSISISANRSTMVREGNANKQSTENTECLHYLPVSLRFLRLELNYQCWNFTCANWVLCVFIPHFLITVQQTTTPNTEKVSSAVRLKKSLRSDFFFFFFKLNYIIIYHTTQWGNSSVAACKQSVIKKLSCFLSTAATRETPKHFWFRFWLTARAERALCEEFLSDPNSYQAAGMIPAVKWFIKPHCCNHPEIITKLFYHVKGQTPTQVNISSCAAQLL